MWTDTTRTQYARARSGFAKHNAAKTIWRQLPRVF